MGFIFREPDIEIDGRDFSDDAFAVDLDIDVVGSEPSTPFHSAWLEYPEDGFLTWSMTVHLYQSFFASRARTHSCSLA